MCIRDRSIFRDRYHRSEFDPLLFALKSVGLLLVLLGLTCLLSLSTAINQDNLVNGSGGFLGQSIQQGLSEILYPAGTALLMFSITLFGLTLFAQISWLSLMDRIGQSTLYWVDQLMIRLVDWNDRRLEAARHAKRVKQQAFKPPITQPKLEPQNNENLSVASLITQMKTSAESIMPKVKSSDAGVCTKSNKALAPVKKTTANPRRKLGEVVEVPQFNLLTILALLNRVASLKSS